VHEGGLVKTVGFSQPKYVGDPLNAVRIFNEKEVDELMVLDIDASRQGKEPNYNMIGKLANECRMPLCYGGGVKSVDHVERLIGLGVEKVAISSGAMARPELISEAAARAGSQSIAVVIDVKVFGDSGAAEVVVLNGTRRTRQDPVAVAEQMQQLGAGEIVLNSVDRDGTMSGYDMELIRRVRNATSLPLTVLGGAGSMSDIAQLILNYGIIGAAAGSVFVFKGKFRAVLINYPSRADKDALIEGVRKQ
jgi:cyclase